MKSVLLHVHRDTGQEGRLQTALDLAHAFDAHLVCVQATPLNAYVGTDPFGGVFVMSQTMATIEQGELEQRAETEERLKQEGLSWDWHHIHGDVAQAIVRQSRLVDLIVVSAAVDVPQRGEPLPLAADIAIHARAPVVAVPLETGRFDVAGPALVAWTDSPEAANALRASLPLLRRASGVAIVTVDEDSSATSAADPSVYLERHGIASAFHRRPRAHQDIADTLLSVIEEQRPAYMVMGAYGHSRLREYLIGGVTRRMLAACPASMLLTH